MTDGPDDADLPELRSSPPEAPAGAEADGPADAGQAAADLSEENDLEHLNQRLRGIASTVELERFASPSAQIEEIADDMLDLMRRTKALEEGQTRILTGLEQMSQQVWQIGQGLARGLEMLRRELVGEQKSLTNLSAFTAIVSLLDSLRGMRSGINAKRHKRYHAQLGAIEVALAALLQTLGFREFHARRGESFDPSRMQCLGYAEGKPGVVLEAVRPGYLTDTRVVRPAGVLICGTPEEERRVTHHGDEHQS